MQFEDEFCKPNIGDMKTAHCYFRYFIYNLGTKNEAWKYHLNGQWFEDDTVKVECSDDGDTTTTVHPTGR